MQRIGIASTPQLKHLTTARRALQDLRQGDTKPETLHRLRTHLRRLQAYLELIGDGPAAKKLGKYVSSSSRLRALQVFEGYLAKVAASQEDLHHVRKRVKRRRAKLMKRRAYHRIDRRLRDHAMPMAAFHQEWLLHRVDALRASHAEALRRLQTRLQGTPRRKLLHRIRLCIKTVRYQEEWVLESSFGRPELVERLKHIQTVLGAYEDAAQFRKWARAWKLDIRSRVQKDWRVARRRARGIGKNLEAVINALTFHRLRLVPSESRPKGPLTAG
jgi:CHAD domain-containing protein